MVIPTIYGYNSNGRVGPSATNTIYELNLDQVSTMVLTESGATRQLTLNDLGTDCPQSEPATLIEKQGPNSRCNPILAAPEPVKNWASPCNACGGFGLFDPPYAVAPLSGGLVQAPVTTTTVYPEETSMPIPTATAETTPSVAAVTSAAPVVPVMTPSVPGSVAPPASGGSNPASAGSSVTSSASSSSSSSSPSSSPMYTGAAAKVTGGLVSLALSLLVSMCLL